LDLTDVTLDEKFTTWNSTSIENFSGGRIQKEKRKKEKKKKRRVPKIFPKLDTDRGGDSFEKRMSVRSV
jgi:hypothetical protein